MTMYRGNDETWRDGIEDRLEAAEKNVGLNVSGRRWLSVGLIALSLTVVIDWWIISSRMTAVEAALGLCQEGEAAEVIAARHRLTREQDNDLCAATCMSVMRLEDIGAAGRISSTCSWGHGGIRSCECSCSVANDEFGRLRIQTIPATESR